MRGLKEREPMIASVYFNSWDSYNRIYPWIQTNAQYPSNIAIPSYNFYYLADAEHTPTRGVRWTDVYLDPAGHGWMMSAIAPVYRQDFLEGVVGVDITVGDLLKEISTLKVPWGGYLILVSDDMKIMVLSPGSRTRFRRARVEPSRHLEPSSGGEVKAEGLDLKKAHDTCELAAALAQHPRGSAKSSSGANPSDFLGRGATCGLATVGCR
jgi:hypothetical protein